MRVLILSNFYPPYSRGGFEERCREVVDTLRQRGHSIRVLTSAYGGDDGSGHENGVFRLLKLESDLLHYRPIRFFTARRGDERANLTALRRTVADFAPNLLFVWGMWNLSRTLPAAIERDGRPLVVYSLGDLWPADLDMHSAYWQAPARHQILRPLKRLLASLALAVMRAEGKPPALRFEHAICVSAAVRDNLVKAGLPLTNARVIHGGIDPQPFLEPSPPRFWERGDRVLHLLYAGGLGSHKGVHTALESLAIMRNCLPDLQVSLTLVGDGHPEYKAHLQAIVETNGLADCVTFMGRVQRSEMPKIYGQSDILLFPSIWEEPLGRTHLEAMASDLVIVGTTTGGAAEVLVDGENALTFAPEDADGLAIQVERLVRNPDLCRRLVRVGKQTVLEKFTLQRMVDEIERYLYSVKTLAAVGQICQTE